MYDHPLSILNPFLFILLICAYMRVVSFLKCLCTSFLATTSQIYEQFNITAPFLVRTHFTCTTLCARRVLHGVEPSIFDIAPCHSTTPTFTASAGPVCVCVVHFFSAHRKLRSSFVYVALREEVASYYISSLTIAS